MTTTAVRPTTGAEADELRRIADPDTPLGKLHMDDFEASCRAVADEHGWVDPNKVSKHLHDRFGEIDPNSYSAKWGPACGRDGFMDTSRHFRVPIDPQHSRGNGNKDVAMRRLRDLASPDGEAGPGGADTLRRPATSP